jgi:hypothetical protein
MKQLLTTILMLTGLFVTAQENAGSKQPRDSVIKPIIPKIISKEEAQFPGGVEGWVRYLQKNLKANTPAKRKAPVGRYSVIVNFTIDTDGSVTDVFAENDPGYGTAEEAVRVIKNGPRWIPARQDGVPVIFKHKQSITFQVSKE